MARTIDALLADFNTKLEGRLSYSDMVFKRLAVLQPLDGVTFPMERIEQREGRKISPFDEQGLTFYHRIESEDVETIPGKGNSSYNRSIFNMVIVGIGYRPNITSATTWNNEDIAQTVMNAIGQGMILDFKERVSVQGRPTTDKLTVLNEEYVGNPIMQEKVLDLIAFKIPYTLEVKQIYCDGATSAVTSLTINPQEQNGTDGQPITQIDITANAPSLLEVSNLPNDLTFEVLSSTTAKITGNSPSSTATITIIATGAGGGRIGDYAAINVGGTTPVTDLTYDNNNQNIWSSTGSGALTQMNPTTTPSNATGVYSGSTPAGISLNSSTGAITVSDFSSIPNGANNFTVTFTANGDFSGAPTFDVTITKNTLWVPEDITAGQVTLQNWYDPTEDDADYLTIVSGVVSQWDDRAGLYNIAQAGTSERPVPGTWNLDSKRSVLFFNDNLNNASVTSSNDFWVFVHFNINSITANQYFMRNTTNDIRLGVDREGTNSFRIFVRAGGTTGFINVPGGFDLLQQNNILSVHYDNTDVDVYVNGALLGSLTVGAHSGMSGNFQFWSFQDSTNALSAGGYSHEFLICDNSGTGLTTADQQRIEGYTAWKRESQGSLDAGHPYKNLPPFN